MTPQSAAHEGRDGDYVATVRCAIENIEGTPPPTERFIPGRYPYTYAYDYMRTHSDHFPGLGHPASRARCAGYVSERAATNEQKDAICRLLADAYIRENRVCLP